MFCLLSKFQERIKNKVRKKWRLFHATDFHSLMFPCFIFCRMLGIFPYKISGSSFEISKPRYILSSVIIGVFCIYLLTIFYMMNVSGDIKFDGIPDALQSNCYSIFSGFITIITYILCGPRMRLLQTVMEISLTLSPESYRKLSWIIHTKDIFGFIFLFGQIFNCRGPSIIYTISKLLGLYVTLLVFQMDMLYINCVCVIKACFQTINDNLTTLRKQMVNDEPHLFTLIYHKQKNSILLMRLKTLQKWHLMISDTVKMLNMIFSLQLLTTVVMTFVEITFNLYFYIVQLIEKVFIINLDKQIWYSYIITSVTYYFTKLALIVWSCESGKNQAQRISTTVHDILAITKDMKIKYELQLFSLQLLHHDNTFSAKGFNVDAIFLTSVVGSITTYLLILIQFMNTTHICDDMSSSINIAQIFKVESDN